MRVEIRDVRHVVAVLLQPVGQRELPEKELAGAGRERRVEDLAVLAVGPIEAHRDVVTPVPDVLAVVVQRELVRPAVVGLPGRVGALEQEVGAAVVAHDEDHVALPAFPFGGELADIDAAQPGCGNFQRLRRPAIGNRAAAAGRSAGRAAPSPRTAPGSACAARPPRRSIPVDRCPGENGTPDWC